MPCTVVDPCTVQCTEDQTLLLHCTLCTFLHVTKKTPSAVQCALWCMQYNARNALWSYMYTAMQVSLSDVVGCKEMQLHCTVRFPLTPVRHIPLVTAPAVCSCLLPITDLPSTIIIVIVKIVVIIIVLCIWIIWYDHPRIDLIIIITIGINSITTSTMITIDASSYNIIIIPENIHQHHHIHPPAPHRHDQ